MFKLKKFVPVILMTATILSGCSILKVENERTGELEYSNASKGAAIGVTGGAVVGSLGGVTGAVVGAAVGGVAGGYYGYTKDEAKKEFNKELNEMGTEVSEIDGMIRIRLSNDIMFEKSSYDLTIKGKEQLNKLLKTALKMEKRYNINISGHTDNTGSRDFNLSLSNKRAETVSFYLYQNGFYAKHISFTGYADIMPLNDNKTELRQSENRRITIDLIEPKK